MKKLGVRLKLILVFSVLMISVGGVITIGLSYSFTHTYEGRVKQYISDISRQITNNYELKIEKLEKVSQEILSNSIIQEKLNRINKEEVSTYEMRLLRSEIENEIARNILFEDTITATTVISLNESVFKVSKEIDTGDMNHFSQEIIIEANGSALWGMVDDGNIVLSRGILDLNTMKPIGHLNIKCDKAMFESLLAEASNIYSNKVIIIDAQGEVICTNIAEKEITHISKENWDNSESTIHFMGEDYYYSFGSVMLNDWQVLMLVPVTVIQQELSFVYIMLVLIPAGCIALGIIGILIITKKMMHPLEVLSKSMEAIESADFSKRIKITSEDEIGRLGMQYNRMSESIENLIEQVYQMDISRKQAEIELLKMQINPHFLYNTLDMINGMVRLDKKEEIINVTSTLGELLRSNIKQGDFVPVSVEMSSVEKYLKIQKYRFGEKISVKYKINEEILDYVIPNFILQPIVENAIIHGLEPQIEPGQIIIGGRCEETQLHFFVQDNGIGMEEFIIKKIYDSCKDQNCREHIGIQNVYLRMLNYYGEKMNFIIKSKKGKGTLVEIYIPLDMLEKE